ncbi:MAG: ABC transporter ATP-binding protein [Firmicutes bacterium]|nr:ABC transporter ATP-binding protein [Bacillota bacterium]
MSSKQAPYAVEMLQVVKRFSQVLAVDHANLQVKQGEVHAVIGENGAGKSTLMRLLYGFYTADSGTIRINGQTVKMTDPGVAIAHGIGMVHQEFMLVPRLNALDNIILGQEPRKGLRVDRQKAREEITRLASELGFQVDLHTEVRDLPVGVQQKVELLKVLYRGASILILDEPTAVLTPQEVDELFEMLENLQKQGKTIILITHKLDEVMAIADRITVMRRGKTVKTVSKDSTTSGELASLMVGRNVILDITPPPVEPGEKVLTVRNLSLQEPGSARVLVDRVSFEVREGEILGIAGVSGNGQSELAEMLTGLTRPTSGEILIRGQEVTFGSVRRKRESGIAHIPEDRRNTGLVMALSVEDNLTIGHQDNPELSGKVLLKRQAIEERSDRLINMFDIRPPRRDVAAWHLSGGNQQKVIIARELAHDPEVLVANQPTRGLDVAAMEYVYHHLLEARSQGKAIVLISMELDEVLTLSDRILVMYNGRIVGEFSRTNADIEQIGLLMLQGREAG